MPLVLIGVDHRATPQDTLGRMTVNGDQLPYALERLAKSEHIAEAVIVSTCMRTELYVEAVRFHGAVHDARAFLADLAEEPLEGLSHFIVERNDESAYAHLFRVACGLESSVVGEPEVLGQVARAWSAARDARTSRALLNTLFKHAVEVGKRARSESGIARGSVSVGQAAVAMAKQRVGDLSAKRVLVVGAGEMGDSMAVALTDAKHNVEVKITNRTLARSEALAERIKGQAVAFERLPELLAEADVVLTSTGAIEPVFTRDMVDSIQSLRANRPLVFVDVAMPADVERSVRDIEAVTVLDMDDLNQFAAVARSERIAEVDLVSAMIDEEVWRYVADVNARTVVPVLAALREKVESIRDLEIERQGKRLKDLDPATAATVESIINAVVAKLLHDPTIRLKAVAGQPDAERMAEAVRYLFDV